MTISSIVAGSTSLLTVSRFNYHTQSARERKVGSNWERLPLMAQWWLPCWPFNLTPIKSVCCWAEEYNRLDNLAGVTINIQDVPCVVAVTEQPLCDIA